MAKNLIKRFLPSPHRIQQSKVLNLLGHRLTNPNLWFLNRYSVATGISIGLFIAYTPLLGGHMLLAALLAIWLRANIAVSVLFVWAANPFTIIPMFGFAYYVGAKIMNVPIMALHIHDWGLCKEIWKPLLLGSTICGAVLAVIGNITVRVCWRLSVSKKWAQRKLRLIASDSDVITAQE